jgi:hypothetical protein
MNGETGTLNSASLHPILFATHHSPFAYFNRSINAIAASGSRTRLHAAV